MKGMKSDDLIAIVDFLYFGEVKVYQENLDSFLAIAAELELKGLEGSIDKDRANSGPKESARMRARPDEQNYLEKRTM